MQQNLEILNTPATLYHRGKRILWTDESIAKMHYVGRRTDTYHPLSHVEVLECLISQINQTDMNISHLRISQGQGKKNMSVSRVVVQADNGLYNHKYTLVNGHNGQVPVIVAPGFEVIACVNGCIVAVKQVKARHTKNVRSTIEHRFDQIITQDLIEREMRAEQVFRMRNTPVSLDESKVLIMTAAHKGFLVKPLKTFREFVNAEDHTVWGLWQAITANEELCSRSYVDRAPDQIHMLEGLIS